MKKTAIIIGATGLTGESVLNRLLNDDRYNCIKVFGRNSTEKHHKKLQEYICDLMDTDTFAKDFEGDEVYCCIGTTAAKTPDKNQYRKIDYGIPVSIASLCKQKDIETLIIISAMGANAKSRIFYNRIKGEMENAVLNMKIKKTILVQPGLIEGKRKEKRPVEFILRKLFSILNLFLVGSFKKYSSINTAVIANAMINLANSSDEISGRISSGELAKIGKYES